VSVVASAAGIRLKSVLAPTDFSATSQKALRHAVAIAEHYGAKIYVAHVVTSLAIAMAGPAARKTATEAEWRDQLENQLLECGAPKGLRYELVVRQGEVWEELDNVIRQKEVDLVVIGARGRRGLRKLFLGSVAEQIFRRADCPVVTVGPSSYQESRVDSVQPNPTYLFPTDFDQASLSALPHAISFANQVPGKLVLFHVVRTRRVAHSFLSTVTVQQLQELIQGIPMKIKPEFVVEFGPTGPVSEKILQAAAKLKVDLIIMGSRRFTHANAASHRPWATAYEVVCGAGCPVVTIRM
jgi:nucleotide-binding universal stress UspA family protein